MSGSAVISEDGRYRYTLDRGWDVGVGNVLWVMLNPSTADEGKDDPTIRKCIGFSQRWGFKSLRVVNLFAFRATKPADLRRADDAVGPRNASVLRDAILENEAIVAAWGFHGAKTQQAAYLRPLLVARGAVCLGLTASGQPNHPLMLSYTVERRRLGLEPQGERL